MLPLAYTDTVAGIAVLAVGGLWILVELRMQVRGRGYRGASADRRDRASMAVLMVSMGLAMSLAFWSAGAAPGAAIAPAEPGVRWALLAVGLAVALAGLVVRQWAITALGRFFTADVRVTAGQTVVDHGPFRVVRHPSYAGLLAVVLGLALALGNWWAPAAVVVAAAATCWRMVVEEQALADGLGEPYRRYAAAHCRLVPGVW